MKMYIPEIGDHIVLTEDWTFQLHNESRNETLAKFFGYIGYYYRGFNWVLENGAPIQPEANYKLNYPDRDSFNNFFGKHNHIEYNKKCREIEETNIEYQKYLADMEVYRKDMESKLIDEITVTLPKGTILAVDRIYIRKGASDYSSITFYAKNMGEVIVKSAMPWNTKQRKIKAFRFWAKLSDCNNIQFEPTEKIK